MIIATHLILRHAFPCICIIPQSNLCLCWSIDYGRQYGASFLHNSEFWNTSSHFLKKQCLHNNANNIITKLKLVCVNSAIQSPRVQDKKIRFKREEWASEFLYLLNYSTLIRFGLADSINAAMTSMPLWQDNSFSIWKSKRKSRVPSIPLTWFFSLLFLAY